MTKSYAYPKNVWIIIKNYINVSHPKHMKEGNNVIISTDVE